jgi:cyclophilin family peptidyl-prolyl cis-trans isomerase/HEAT repeat protein
MTFAAKLLFTRQLKFAVFSLLFPVFSGVPAVVLAQPKTTAGVPPTVLLQIIRAEDERLCDDVLLGLLSHRDSTVRLRAALAAGRIGNDLAVPPLILLMQNNKDLKVRSMAVFALGEIESPKAAEALRAELGKNNAQQLRGRIAEALGKIAAALPQTNEAQKKEIGKSVLEILNFEARRRPASDTDVVLLALTATLRARPEGAGTAVAEFLSSSEPRIRADAGNTLARLRAKEGNEQLRRLLTSDPDPNVRANAARVLGATEDKSAYDGLLDRAWKDDDKRVRVSSIRSLAALKDARAADTLMQVQVAGNDELLELATMIGRVLAGTESQPATTWLRSARSRLGRSPEVEIALVRVSPSVYLPELVNETEARRKVQETILLDWRAASGLAQGLGEIAALPDSTKDKAKLAVQAQELLRAMLDYRNAPEKPNTLVAVHSEYAVPDVLRALAAFKPANADSLYREHLKESDVVVRTTAAELLGDLPASSNNIEALSSALRFALQEKDSNDAALAILDALAKYKNRSTNTTLMWALDSKDYIVRRKAIESLKATGAGDFSHRLGQPASQNSAADYARAISRARKRVVAAVTTTKGRFTVELFPQEAPLNVDNFVQLARRKYFNGIVFHRVVPNFVIQGGDPRGDGNGGPGYQIRCEINEVPYERGAVGMALSGKDTGGSQWFVTHAPQPHLDGGYTVFGRVVAGMDVVDSIVRGDVINSIAITERPAPKTKTAPVKILNY